MSYVKVYTANNSTLRNISSTLSSMQGRNISFTNNVSSISFQTNDMIRNVKNVRLGTNITQIQNSCFYDCSVLNNVSMPSINELGNYAFYNCSSLQLDQTPNKLRKLGYRCFGNCTKITSISVIMQNAQYIGNEVFVGCNSLTSITIGGNTYVSRGMFSGCDYITNVNLDKCEKIEDLGFYNCKSINDVKLPENMKSLGASCFVGIEHLNLLSVENTSISSIGQDFLSGCTSQTTLHLPVSFNNLSCFNANCFRGSSVLSVTMDGINSRTVDASSKDGKISNFGADHTIIYITSDGKKYNVTTTKTSTGTTTTTVTPTTSSKTAIIVCINTSTTSVRRFHGAFLWRDIFKSYIDDYNDNNDNIYWLFDICGSYKTENMQDLSVFKNRKDPTFTNLDNAFIDVNGKNYDNLIYIFEDHGSSDASVTQGKWYHRENLWTRLSQFKGKNVLSIISTCYAGAQASPPKSVKTAYPDWNVGKNILFLCAGPANEVTTRSDRRCIYCTKSTKHESNNFTYNIQNELGAYNSTRPIQKITISYSDMIKTFPKQRKVYEPTGSGFNRSKQFLTF